MDSTVKEYMLTTIDNPWNPFTHFDEWLQTDIAKGYNTLGYVARIAKTNSDMNDELYLTKVNEAIDEIIKYNPTNIYVKVDEQTNTNELYNKFGKQLFNELETT